MASILKVDKLDPQSGTALEIGTSGDTITVPSGATLDISSATLTPPATMPASSGINLTALNATNLGSGTVAVARGGTGTTSYTAGITAASQWRLTTTFTGDASPIASNLEEVDTFNSGIIGSSMTQSSGVFTFPSTGIWWISAHFYWLLNGANRAAQGFIQTTGDGGSSWDGDPAVYADANIPDFSADSVAMGHADYIFDVVATDQEQVRFKVSQVNDSTSTVGSSSYNQTYFTFIRLGDT